MRLEDEEDEIATLDVAAEEALARPKTPNTTRKTSLSGQMRNQVKGPYSQRRKTSQTTVVMRM
jgi:hypothetical protein